MASTTSTTIKISNISPAASEKTIADFFSFCGKIQNLSMRRQGASVEAIVEFESEAAAKTALLLTNALIEDRPITVAPFVPPAAAAPAALVPDADAAPTAAATGSTDAAPKSAFAIGHDDDDDDDEAAGGESAQVSHMRPDEIPHKPFTVSDEERTKTSVVASLLASGYTLGVGAMDAARELDERAKISQNINHGAEVARHKLQEFDQQLGISTTATVVGAQIAQGASALGDSISTAWRNIDTSYHVSEKTNAATTTISESVRSATSAALENAAVASTVQTLSSWGAAFTNMLAPIAESATREVEQIKHETKQKIDEVDRSRATAVADHEAGGLSHATPASNDSATTTTTVAASTTSTGTTAATASPSV